VKAPCALVLLAVACGGTSELGARDGAIPDAAAGDRDAGLSDGGELDEVVVHPGSLEERPAVPAASRYGEPTLLFATAEGLFRWDGTAQRAARIRAQTDDFSFGWYSEPSPRHDALLLPEDDAL
jgi:hypothetical protein